DGVASGRANVGRARADVDSRPDGWRARNATRRPREVFDRVSLNAACSAHADVELDSGELITAVSRRRPASRPIGCTAADDVIRYREVVTRSVVNVNRAVHPAR